MIGQEWGEKKQVSYASHTGRQNWQPISSEWTGVGSKLKSLSA